MTQPKTIAADALKRRVEDAFTRVHRQRMQDVPILNPALRVEAVGLRLWDDDFLLVLITPWSMNLVLLPGNEDKAARWRSQGLGATALHQFPAGRFQFIIGEEEGKGWYQMCSLFSPVLEFENQQAAVLTAAAALQALLDPETNEDKPGETETARGKAPARPARVSRRGLLTGDLKAREAGKP